MLCGLDNTLLSFLCFTQMTAGGTAAQVWHETTSTPKQVPRWDKSSFSALCFHSKMFRDIEVGNGSVHQLQLWLLNFTVVTLAACMLGVVVIMRLPADNRSSWCQYNPYSQKRRPSKCPYLAGPRPLPSISGSRSSGGTGPWSWGSGDRPAWSTSL